MKALFTTLFILLVSISYSQTTVSGTVVDGDDLPIPGANVIVVGTTTGVATDFDGSFTLTINQSPPFMLQASSVGFTTMTIEVTQNNQVVKFVLTEGTQLDEIVISASRTPERIFESPVTVERFGLKDIKNTASSDFYDGLENLKASLVFEYVEEVCCVVWVAHYVA